MSIKQKADTDGNAKVKLLRLPDVAERTGLSRSSIYKEISRGRFPMPLKLTGLRASFWKQGDVDEWLSNGVRGLDRAEYYGRAGKTFGQNQRARKALKG